MFFETMSAMGGIAFAVLGIALAVILPCMGSAKGTLFVGQASAGVVAEDPGKFGKLLILEALPGTQGVYGLLIGFLMMMNLGLLGGEVDINAIPMNYGFAMLFAGLPLAVVGYVSAIAQGKVAAAGVGIVAKKPDEAGKAIILSVMVETFAILGLLVSILLVTGLGTPV